MATVIATAAAAIKDRLIIGTTTQEPSTTHISTWLVDALKQLWVDLPPVKRSIVTVTNDTATLAADQTFYVRYKQKLLLPDVEWGDDGAALWFDTGIIDSGDTVAVWSVKAPDFTASSIDSTCLFGTDALEELATVMATAQALERLANVAATQGEQQAAALMRVEWGDRLDRLYKWHMGRWQQWQATMEAGYQRRAMLGDLPPRRTPYANFQNASSIENPLTGVRSDA